MHIGWTHVAELPPGRPVGTRNRTYDAKNCSRRRRRKSRTMRNRVLSHLPRSPDERFWDGRAPHGNTRERAEVARCRVARQKRVPTAETPWRAVAIVQLDAGGQPMFLRRTSAGGAAFQSSFLNIDRRVPQPDSWHL